MKLEGLHPKAAVVFVGLNNFTDTPDQIAAGVRAVVKKTQATFPGVKILLVSLIPNGRSDEKMARANEILRTYADHQNICYIDIYSHMPRQGDNWKNLMPDKLHFTTEGYEMWAEQMEPALQKIMPVSSVGSLVNADPAPEVSADTLRLVSHLD
jgi:lysophospholipase L1-like esterase